MNKYPYKIGEYEDCQNYNGGVFFVKKVLINALLIVSFIIIYLLQVNLFSWFKIAGVMPNLFVIFILFIGLFFSRGLGIAYSVIFGFLLDLFIGKKIGISAVMFGFVGLIGGIFDKNFSKESRMTIIIMVMVTTCVYELGSYILGYFINGYSFEILQFIKLLLIEILYNGMITIIFYPLMQNLGYKIEEEYKGNKILTRYF